MVNYQRNQELITHTITITIIENPLVSVALGFSVTVAVVRIVRWILDILP